MTRTSTPTLAPPALHESAIALREALQSSPRRVSFAVLDVVGVGAVNRRLGHAAGDRLLSAFGAHLAAEATATEGVWRLGADQWAVLMPGRAARSSRRRIERLARRMAGATAGVPGQIAPLAFRAGGTTVRAGKTPADVAGAFADAGGALQRARSEGTTVVWA